LLPREGIEGEEEEEEEEERGGKATGKSRFRAGGLHDGLEWLQKRRCWEDGFFGEVIIDHDEDQ
jgi:hypothetical protein